MIRKIRALIIILSLFSYCLPIMVFAADNLANKLSGRILLQVEENGEAYYVNPQDLHRYYMGRPRDAFDLMRKFGIGITDADLYRIPIGLSFLSGKDVDNDGLPNDLEISLGSDPLQSDSDGDAYPDKVELDMGYDPLSRNKLSLDSSFAASKKGLIFLQVEKNGEAWYVSPTDNKRYFLGRPENAFDLMRGLGLGITNSDMNSIPLGTGDQWTGAVEQTVNGYDMAVMEKRIHDLINQERRKKGFSVLQWRDDLAAVARRHSFDLAKENLSITSEEYVCDYPIIHHEGLEFGLYSDDRLYAMNVNDFSKAGENIALVSAGSFKFLTGPGGANLTKVEECQDRLDLWEKELKEKLEKEVNENAKMDIIIAELKKREQQLSKEDIKIQNIDWKSENEIGDEMVEGWMNSPGHRANILDSDFEQAGIGVAYVNGYFIATQVFIKKAECGYVGGTCCVQEGYLPACFSPLACSNMICREK